MRALAYLPGMPEKRAMPDSRHILSVADALCGVATLVSVFAVRAGRGRGVGLAILWVAFGVLSCGLYARGVERAALPVGNIFELLHALAWGVVAADIFLRLSSQIRLPAAPVAGLAFLFGASSLFCPVADGPPSGALGENPWLGVHVGSIILAFSVFSALALNSLAYLVQHASLSSHHPGVISRVLPPLRQLDRVGVQLLGNGLGLFTIALAVGFASFAGRADVPAATWFKLGVGLLVWAGYAALFVARRAERIGARAAARAAVLLFVAALVSFWPVGLTRKPAAPVSTEVRP